MAYLKTLSECEPFVRIAKLRESKIFYVQMQIQTALCVKTKKEYLSTLRMLNALINAKNDLDQLPFDTIFICDMKLYRVTFPTVTVLITIKNDFLIIILE